MALVTHQVQGSYATFTSRPISWRRGVEPKRFLLRSTFVKRNSCLCVGVPVIQESKGKSLRILSFKGKTDESGGRGSGSKSAKNSVEYSYVPQDREEILTESSKVQNGQISSMPEAVERLSGSLVIQNLFKSWLTLLHTPSPDLVVDGTLEGPSSSKETSETINVTQNKERGEILKAVWCHFLGMDATIKMALIIFFPMYVAVNIKYGAEVSKDMTPFWIGGPLLVALYVKMFNLVCILYAFTFRQTVKVIKNSPSYCLMTYDFIVSGKLKDIVRVYLWQPLVDISKFDYKDVLKRVEAWWEAKKVAWDEKTVDYVESIWPYYCRTVRFLKRANLM